jgi:FkbM family methyltransferase
MVSFFSIFNIQSPIKILDLGASIIDSCNPSYSNLIETKNCQIIGIDADHKECTRLNEKLSHLKYNFLPVAIFDGSIQNFYHCKTPTCSSLYEPNIELCKIFHDFSDWLEITKIEKVQTKKLDDLEKLIGDVDFLKADIQGAELVALTHGKSILNKLMVAEVEVKFIEQYKGQPLFAEVDQFFRKNDFLFHSFTGYGTRGIKPLIRNGDKRKGFKQWLWSDAIFIKDIFSENNIYSQEKYVKMAATLHEVYKFYDIALYVLSLTDKHYGTLYANKYLNTIKPFLEKNL